MLLCANHCITWKSTIVYGRSWRIMKALNEKRSAEARAVSTAGERVPGRDNDSSRSGTPCMVSWKVMPMCLISVSMYFLKIFCTFDKLNNMRTAYRNVYVWPGTDFKFTELLQRDKYSREKGLKAFCFSSDTLPLLFSFHLSLCQPLFPELMTVREGTEKQKQTGSCFNQGHICKPVCILF